MSTIWNHLILLHSHISVSLIFLSAILLTNICTLSYRPRLFYLGSQTSFHVLNFIHDDLMKSFGTFPVNQISQVIVKEIPLTFPVVTLSCGDTWKQKKILYFSFLHFFFISFLPFHFFSSFFCPSIKPKLFRFLTILLGNKKVWLFLNFSFCSFTLLRLYPNNLDFLHLLRGHYFKLD